MSKKKTLAEIHAEIMSRIFLPHKKDQDTVIYMSRTSPTAEVTTSDKRVINSLFKKQIVNPSSITVKSFDSGSVTFSLASEMVKFVLPSSRRPLTDAEKAERHARLFSNHMKGVESEDA